LAYSTIQIRLQRLNDIIDIPPMGQLDEST